MPPALSQPAFLATWQGKVRERRISARRAPLDTPQLTSEAYSSGTLSTATKRNEVLAGLLRASPVR
jgi:hypothetical protein